MFPSQNNMGPSLPSINLENMDYRDHEMNLTSPRSLNICRQNGVSIKDLYFYNFYEYRDMHPEIKSLSIEIQQSHYFHDQGVREVLLGKLIRERRELIDKQNELYLKQKEIKKEEEKKKKIEEKKKKK